MSTQPIYFQVQELYVQVPVFITNISTEVQKAESHLNAQVRESSSALQTNTYELLSKFVPINLHSFGKRHRAMLQIGVLWHMYVCDSQAGLQSQQDCAACCKQLMLLRQQHDEVNFACMMQLISHHDDCPSYRGAGIWKRLSKLK